MSKEHLSGYQARDYEVVDYQMYVDAPSGLSFRGPEPTNLEDGEYITCLGAAQTLGCFCETSFPKILETELGMPAVNFGYGGAGPAFYLKHPALIETVNRGRLAVLQIMSGRSESNRLYDSGGLEYLTRRADGEKVAAQDAYAALLADNPPPLPGFAGKILRAVQAPAAIKDVIAETRANWVKSNLALMEQIRVPIVLLWYSRREPDFHRSGRAAWWWQRYDNVVSMFGDYPQFINGAMVEAIKPKASDYVHCVTKRGSPQKLYSRFTGEPVSVDTSNDRKDLRGVHTHNAYYPSPEMNEDAAAALIPAIKKILAETS